MNFFLDSTVLFNDPFLEGIFNKKLLKLCEYHAFDIYISRVVFEESRNNLEQNVSKIVNEIKKKEKDLKNLYPYQTNLISLNIELEKILQRFDNFYQRSYYSQFIKILSVDNNLLPELIHRSIKRLKPFTEKNRNFEMLLLGLHMLNLLKKRTWTIVFL